MVKIPKVASRSMAMPQHYIDLFTNNICYVERFIYDGIVRGFQFMKSFNVEYIDGKRDITEKYSIDLVDHYHSILKRQAYRKITYRYYMKDLRIEDILLSIKNK